MSESSTAEQLTAQLNAPDSGATPPASEGAQPAATPAAGAATPPYLKVNDRTVYNSAEDAIKGFNELQGRVTSLSQWEQLIASPIDKGGFGLTDPKQVAALLDELADIRAKNQQQATPAADSTASAVQKAAAGDKLAYDSLSPEWKAHVDYLRKLGYVDENALNDRLKPLQERLDSIDAQNEEAYVAEVNNAVDHGTTLLEGIMKDAGLAITPELLESVGNSVGARIDRDSYDQYGRIIPNSLADQFLRGNEAQRKAIISEQFSLFTKFGDAYATAKTAGYVAAKTAAQGTQPRTLPPGSGPSSTPRTTRMTEDQRKAALSEILVAGGMK